MVLTFLRHGSNIWLALGLAPLTDDVVHAAARSGSLARAREHRFSGGEAMVA